MAQYRVKKGDTLWGISQKLLGSGSKWKSLGYKGDPRRLQVGTVLNYGGPTRPKKGSTSKADDYSSTAVKNIPKAKSFAEMLPYAQAWGELEPIAQQSAAQLVNPEAIRAYNLAHGQYMGGMASSGGGRFGRGWGGVGSLQADAERQRKVALQDMLSGYQEGFKTLFYNPSETAWNKATTQGTVGTMPKVPSWGEFAEQYGQGTPTTVGGYSWGESPFIGNQPGWPSSRPKGGSRGLF